MFKYKGIYNLIVNVRLILKLIYKVKTIFFCKDILLVWPGYRYLGMFSGNIIIFFMMYLNICLYKICNYIIVPLCIQQIQFIYNLKHNIYRLHLLGRGENV